MANGSPSSRRQTWAMLGAFSVVSAKSGRTARARSANSRTASDWAITSTGSSGCGNESGGIGKTFSARIRSVSRLVATIRRSAAAWSNSPRSGPIDVTCSRLSSISNISWSRRRVSRTRSESPVPEAGRSRARTIASKADSGSLSADRSTKKTPSAKRSSCSAATWRARRVLPAPPGPAMVIRRALGELIISSMADSSLSRPRNSVACSGRLLGRESSVRGAGNSARRSSCTS